MNVDPLILALRREGDRMLVLERVFSASRSRVFDAFTDDTLVPRWMGTPGWPMTVCKHDLRTGGAIRYEWAGEEGSMAMSGTYRAVDRPHRTEHVEVFDEDWTGGEVHVVTEFIEQSPGQTLVRMTLTYATTDDRERVVSSGMDRGIDMNYLALDHLLAGRDRWFVVDPERDLVLERIVEAQPSQIWDAWTNPAMLAQWFAPAPWSVASAVVDPTVGGAFHVVMQSPEGEPMDGGAGCILAAIEHRLLAWTDALGPGFVPRPESFFTALVRMDRHQRGTRYQIIARHGTPEARERHESMGFFTGWGTAADQMEALIATNVSVTPS